MSYNGSGVFVINTTGQPVVSGTVISSTAFNALTADLATGLSTALTKDGQTTPTNNIKMGSFKITGLGTGTAATDAANVAQVQNGSTSYLTVSGTNTITGSLIPALTAYTTGATYYFVAAGANTGAVTINIDGLGAKDIKTNGTTPLASGDIVSGQVVAITYDGTQFQYVNHPSNASVTGTANGVAYFNGSGAIASGTTLVFNGSNLSVGTGASTPPVAVTFSATAMTLNCNLSNVFTTTFTANVTTAPTISNPIDGQTINWFITQDGTGSRTMTWPSSFKWPGGSAGVLSTAANSVDLLLAVYRSSTGFWYASLSKGFA